MHCYNLHIGQLYRNLQDRLACSKLSSPLRSIRDTKLRPLLSSQPTPYSSPASTLPSHSQAELTITGMWQYSNSGYITSCLECSFPNTQEGSFNLRVYSNSSSSGRPSFSLQSWDYLTQSPFPGISSIHHRLTLLY